jgi:hypothetical protein
MKKNTAINKVILIVVLIESITFSQAYSQKDSIKSKWIKKIDFRTVMPAGLYFNRIEGYTPFFYEDMVFKSLKNLNVIANVNYATYKNNLTYFLEVNYPISKGKITLGSSYFDSYISNESWTMSRLTNTVAGIFAGKDYMNYYGIKGFSFPIRYLINKKTSLELKYIRLDYESLGDSTSFAKPLFTKTKGFRVNPPIDEAKQNALEFRFSFNNISDSPFFGKRGWFSQIICRKEYGDLVNKSLNIASGGYIPTWLDQRFYIAGKLILNNGDYRQQYLYSFGGMGVMRALDPYSDVGQNLAYGNIEYQFSRILKSKKYWMKPVLFSELGKIWDSTDVPVTVKHHDITTVAGLGLIFKDIRFNLARQTGSSGNWKFSLNIKPGSLTSK